MGTTTGAAIGGLSGGMAVCGGSENVIVGGTAASWVGGEALIAGTVTCTGRLVATRSVDGISIASPNLLTSIAVDKLTGAIAGICNGWV